MMKRREKQKMTKIIVRTVCIMFFIRKPALTFAIRNPTKADASIGITGIKKDRMIQTGYTMMDG